MKNCLPYYKAYPRDFIEGTVGMSFELKGAYRLVLDLIYLQGGELPDDAKYISGLMGCSVRAWNKYKIALIEMNKIQCENGIISNFRATLELESLAKVQDKQRENASGPRKNKDLQKPRHSQPEPEPEPNTSTDVEVAPAPAESDPLEREQILKAIGADPVSGMIGPNGTMIGRTTDMAEQAKWTALGISLDDQCAIIRERVQSAARGGKVLAPRSFSYFSGAMSDFAAAKSKPMPIGVASHSQATATDAKLARWNRIAGQA